MQVSDDMEWGRQKLGLRNRRRDLYMAGEGIVDKEEAIGADLALLARCNHTIQVGKNRSTTVDMLCSSEWLVCLLANTISYKIMAN